MKKRILAISLALILLSATACNTQQPSQSTPASSAPSSSAPSGSEPPSSQDPSGEKVYPEVENFNPTGFPIVDEKITLRIFSGKHPLQIDYADMIQWQTYEEMTNIHIEWELVEQANMVERKNILLNTNDLPDVFFKQGLTNADLVSFGPQQGAFIQLDELIEIYGENIKREAANYPDLLPAVTMYDGHIYSMPNVAGMSSSTTAFYFVNQAWLDTLKLSMPTTLDELYTVLKAFKEQDPNGNGKADEVPLLSSAWGIQGLAFMLGGAYGLGNAGRQNMFVDYAPDGSVRFIPTTDEYKAVIEYLKTLYAEDLLNHDIFSITDKDVTARGEEGIAGSFVFANPIIIGNTYQADFKPLTQALKGPNGDQLWNLRGSSVTSKTSYVITNKCENPEAAFRWGEWFYSEEGQRFFWLGIEDVTYYKNDKGEYRHTDLIMKNPNGLTKDEATGQYFARFMGGPTVKKLENSLDHGDAIPEVVEAASLMEKYFPTTIWPSFNYTPEENDVLTTVITDLDTYIVESISKFITGDLQMSEWDNYVKNCEKMGVSQYTAIVEAALSRLQ